MRGAGSELLFIINTVEEIHSFKLLSLKEEQQALAKEIFHKGNFEYYRDLKELAGENLDVFNTGLKQEL